MAKTFIPLIMNKFFLYIKVTLLILLLTNCNTLTDYYTAEVTKVVFELENSKLIIYYTGKDLDDSDFRYWSDKDRSIVMDFNDLFKVDGVPLQEDKEKWESSEYYEEDKYLSVTTDTVISENSIFSIDKNITIYTKNYHLGFYFPDGEIELLKTEVPITIISSNE